MNPSSRLYERIAASKKRGEKLFAVLIDPDAIRMQQLERIVDLGNEHAVDFFFIGGSLMMDDVLDPCLDYIKRNSVIPTILFPGSPMQINDKADGMLFLSLISGRNPDLLIGQQVTAAPYLRKTNLELLPTGYMLIESGRMTTANYISHTLPIPADKPSIAACTAMAGEMLGLKLMYLDGGSGAEHAVPRKMIEQVAAAVETPIIVGGGIRSADQAQITAQAGADLIVVGTSIERDPELLQSIATVLHSFPRNSRVKIALEDTTRL